MTAAVTIAPTPGTAWALAAFGRNGSHIVTNEHVLPALSPLPPEALRLDSKTVGVLSALGVRTIDSLLQLSRNDLAVRFGPAILMRIDQATGTAPEPLTYLVHRSPIRATLEFEGAIESLDAIHFAVQELTRQIAAQLAARGQGGAGATPDVPPAVCIACRKSYPVGAPVSQRIGTVKADLLRD